MDLIDELGRSARWSMGRLRQRLRDRQVVRLTTPMAQPLGVILLSYLIDPFLVEWSTVAPTDPIRWHTNFWECRQIAQTFLNLGYSVDVISYLNRHFQPREKYAAVISCSWESLPKSAGSMGWESRRAGAEKGFSAQPLTAPSSVPVLTKPARGRSGERRSRGR